MFERFIYRVIEDQIAEFQANPKLLRCYFEDVKGLDSTEVDEILRYFQSKPPSILHSFARKHDDPPYYAIVLAEETETETAMSDYVGAVGEREVQDLDGNQVFESDPILGYISEKTFMILTVTEHPDVTRYYYELLRAFMMRGREFLREQGGALTMRYMGGDIAPDENYLPAHLIVRQFTLRVQFEEAIIGAKDPNTFREVSAFRATEALPVGGRFGRIEPVPESEIDP